MPRRIASPCLLAAATLLSGCGQDAAPPTPAPAPAASPAISDTNPSIKSLPVEPKPDASPGTKP